MAHHQTACHRRAPGQSGFSLVEILVTIFIFGVVTVGLLVIFDNSSRLARSQTQLANIQQGQRVGHSEIVRYVRMAGVGGLPLNRLRIPDADKAAKNYDLQGAFPHGYAMAVYNNVAADTNIKEVVDPTLVETGGDEVLPGSDVLIVRGVFTTPVYYFDPPLTLAETDLSADEKALTRTLQIAGVSRITDEGGDDRLQDLGPLEDMLKAAFSRTEGAEKPEALLARDLLNPNAYAVLAFDWDDGSLADVTSLDSSECQVTKPDGFELRAECLQVPVVLDSRTTEGEGYVAMTSGTTLATGSGGVTLKDKDGNDLVELPTRIGSIGLLEEYRFFVRVEKIWDGLTGQQRIAPVLSRARFLPGTNVEVETVDIADNVIDLQLALGVETDSFGDAGYGTITDAASGTDEVLFNASADSLSGNPPYIDPPVGSIPGGHGVWFNDELEYHFLRINTIVQADRRSDKGFQSPLLSTIEDYNRGNYSLNDPDTFNSVDARRFRRRWLQTTVELRNLN